MTDEERERRAREARFIRRVAEGAAICWVTMEELVLDAITGSCESEGLVVEIKVRRYPIEEDQP